MSSGHNIKTVLSLYDEKRMARDTLATNNLKNILDKYPKTKSARSAYSALVCRRITSKNTISEDEIQSAKKAYNKTLIDACNSEGMTIDDLSPTYDCQTCKDTGYIGENEKKYCQCLLNAVAKLTISNGSFNSEHSFDNFDLNLFPNDKIINKNNQTQREYMKYIMERMIKWCNVFPNTNKKQLLITGATGVGKTYLLNCISKMMIQLNYGVILTTGEGINNATLSIINTKDNSSLNMIKTCQLLIIDDLGIEPFLNNITVETLYAIIEYRNIHNLHTIISTNLDLKTLQTRYGFRVFSRIASAQNTTRLRIFGNDLRR